MKKVLIIDDEPLLLKSMCMSLNYKGFEAFGAMDGYEGIKSAEQNAPDFIILDIMMPGIDGWDTLKLLKENPKTREIPVIIFTAKEYSNGTMLARQKGAIDLITKPIDPNLLVLLLRRYSTKE